MCGNLLRARAADHAAWPQDVAAVHLIQRAIDFIARNVNAKISLFRQQTPPTTSDSAAIVEDLLPHLRALSAASDSGVYIAHTDHTSLHLRLCDVMGRSFQFPVEVLARFEGKDGDLLVRGRCVSVFRIDSHLIQVLEALVRMWMSDSDEA